MNDCVSSVLKDIDKRQRTRKVGGVLFRFMRRFQAKGSGSGSSSSSSSGSGSGRKMGMAKGEPGHIRFVPSNRVRNWTRDNALLVERNINIEALRSSVPYLFLHARNACWPNSGNICNDRQDRFCIHTFFIQALKRVNSTTTYFLEFHWHQFQSIAEEQPCPVLGIAALQHCTIRIVRRRSRSTAAWGKETILPRNRSDRPFRHPTKRQPSILAKAHGGHSTLRRCDNVCRSDNS